MTRGERLLYHQIHPLKLATDWGTGLIAAWLFWQHRPWWALALGFIPPVLVTVVLVRRGELEWLRQLEIGRRLARSMTRRVEAARLAGLLPLWGGAWYHEPVMMIAGIVWILACWAWVLRP
jgi:hypothetical protein